MFVTVVYSALGLFAFRISYFFKDTHGYLWGAVAQWLGRRTGDRGVLGSTPGGATLKLWQFRLARFAHVFQRNHLKLLVSSYGEYVRASKIFHTGC